MPNVLLFRDALPLAAPARENQTSQYTLQVHRKQKSSAKDMAIATTKEKDTKSKEQ
jgi:hypothetical protein